MEEKQKNRRAFLVLLFLSTLISGILFRLAWIQIFTTRAFSWKGVDLVAQSVEQRREKLVLSTGRGMINDRNGNPLTGKEVTGLAIFPAVHLWVKNEDKMQKLSATLGLSKEKTIEVLKGVKHADFWRDEKDKIIPLNDGQIKGIADLSLPGLTALKVTERYGQDQVARQVIGYTGYKGTTDRVGIAGLEESFQPFLKGVGEKSVSYFVDGKGRPMYGLNIRQQDPTNSFYPLSLTTTLDYSMQKMAEDAFSSAGIKEGAGVILDVKTRKVLAMVSRPAFTPENTETQRNNELFQDGLENRAITRMTPGSVFKIVVAAAALEEGIVKPGDHFYCSGNYGKYGFTCWKKDGHGDITFEQAFADSCNITFAEIAKKVGPEKIKEYAARLGLTEALSWEKDPFYEVKGFKQLPHEEAGQVFAPGSQENDEGVLIQTGIGQRDVQITPLEAASMAAVIAGDGQGQEIRIVDSILYQNGSPFYTFEDRPLATKGLKPETINWLRKFMGDVVEQGTGQKLKNLPLPVAGKTGTAQIARKDGTKYNLWFVGFMPRENPRYAMAIVAQNQSDSGNSPALKVMETLDRGIANLEASSGKR